VPDGKGGLYLVAAVRTLHLSRDKTKPEPFCAQGSAAGAAMLARDGALLLGQGTTVTRVDAKGKVEVVATGFAEIFGVALDAEGRLHVSDWERGEVVRLEGKERKVVAKGLSYPSGLVFDSAGRLYIKESGRMTNRDMVIRRVEADGSVKPFATVPSVTRWQKPDPAPQPPAK